MQNTEIHPITHQTLSFVEEVDFEAQIKYFTLADGLRHFLQITSTMHSYELFVMLGRLHKQMPKSIFETDVSTTRCSGRGWKGRNLL